MAKESLTSLKLQLDKAIQERDANLQTAQRAVTIANDLNSKLINIETLLGNASFIEKGFFKKVWWVITNMDKLVNLIEEIIKQIKEWKDYIVALNKPANPVPTP